MYIYAGMDLEDVRKFETQLQEETNKKVLTGVDIEEQDSTGSSSAATSN